MYTVSNKDYMYEQGLSNDDLTFLRYSQKHERKILKLFLMCHLYRIFMKSFLNTVVCENYLMECYLMDSKIVQIIIKEIIESGNYTLEGVAYHTRVPFDIIYEAACGINNNLSIMSWSRIADLYLQVKPEISNILAQRLLEIKDKNQNGFVSLMQEPSSIK
jgi:hypothetical protein